jgi:hypothetical protein
LESEKSSPAAVETAAGSLEETESLKSGDEKDDTQSAAAGSTDGINEQEQDQEAKEDEDDFSDDDN